MLQSNNKEYGVIVIGGGHAGCEAALVSARLGVETLLITMNIDTIALMSCNPAIGGLAKGQIVREIDALGGEMGKCIDSTGIQFRVLNTSKGPAVQAYRAQADRNLYKSEMKRKLDKLINLDIKQGIVEELLTEKGKVRGVKMDYGISYKGKAVVVAAGTFLRGLIHIGLQRFPAGRAGEFASHGLADSLEKLGLEMGRLKTGTPSRIKSNSIDFTHLTVQLGDQSPKPFSFSTKEIIQKQVPCHLTHTNEATHKIIEDNLDRSPLYSGVIRGIGARYCPSIEDKIKRFPDKNRHQVFLEPESYNAVECYPNGVSTSLPVDVQLAFLRTIKGLEKVEIVRPGYAIEYDFVYPTQLLPTLETKLIENLFLAGQINGTSGYEEAAGQGIIAGINASRKVSGRGSFILGRSDAYIGVLIDDLITKGVEEPYRMFTSRAEYRLILRGDNADLRLAGKAMELGLLPEEEKLRFFDKKRKIEEELDRLKNSIVKIDPLTGTQLNQPSSLLNLLKRPDTHYNNIESLNPPPVELTGDIKNQIEIQAKYEGYINRQIIEISRLKKLDRKIIPHDINYGAIQGLSKEVQEKLHKIRPLTISQASRIPGITPASVSALLVFLEKNRRKKKE